MTSEDLCLAKRLVYLPPPPPALAVVLPVYWQGKGGGWLLGEPLRPTRRPGRKTVMDGGWPPLLLLTCWLGPMRYSWDLGQERDAKRFKNILRNSLRCQPSCQVVLSKESQALHPCTHMQSGGIRSRSFFNLLLSHSRLETPATYCSNILLFPAKTITREIRFLDVALLWAKHAPPLNQNVKNVRTITNWASSKGSRCFNFMQVFVF